MNLIEISYPDSALDVAAREALGNAIVSNLLVAPDAPAEALERASRLTHVYFHPAQSWITGAGPLSPDAPWPLIVTITVPEAWREELSRHAIGAVWAALARQVPGIDLQQPGAVWINVVGVADGSIGMNGKPAGSSDIVRYLTRDLAVSDGAGLPDGVVIDPVCGMRVHLGRKAITLDHDGRTLGFCATGCRDVYAHDHATRVSARESAG